MMHSKLGLQCGAAFAGIFAAVLATSSAEAATVGFTIMNGGTEVALGSFSYSSANPILAYGDLDSFFLTIGASTYDLSFVTDPSRSTNTYFQFDTVAGEFIDAPVSAMYGLNTELASMADNYGDGFIFTFGDNQYFTYDGGPTPDKYHQPWTDIAFNNSTQNNVPEPASLFLLAGGIAGLGAFRRRTKAA